MHRSKDFGLDKEHYLGDGVVTGYALYRGGWCTSSLRILPCLAAHCRNACRKIVKVMDLAMKKRSTGHWIK